MARPRSQRALRLVALATVTGCSLLVTACSGAASGSSAPGVINAVGAESQYANVLSQIGGSYVHVSSILDNPNTDPHTFEASTTVAEEVGRADLIVQNGVGYDSFMDHIEAASPSAERKVIVAQHVLGLPDATPNPHLWYSPKTMPAVAKVMATDLSDLDPAHRAYFEARLQTFDTSLESWFDAIATFRKDHRRDTGGHHRAGGRLPARCDGHEEPDAVRVPGRHHERGRPLS